MSNLKTRKTAKWIQATDETTMNLLDIYLKSQYGPRKLSDLGQMVVTNIDSITDIVYALYGTSWDRLWTDYTSEYNPIWNIDGTETETETRNLTQSHTGTDNYLHSGNDTMQTSGTDTNSSTGTDSFKKTGSYTTEVDESTYGFNSSAASPSGKTVTTETPSTTDTTNYGKTDTTQYGKTDTNTYNSSNNNTKNLTDTDTGTVTRELKRGGNIGVTKTQELLTADQEYWTNMKSKFYKQVMKDIVDEITYKIHTEECDEYSIDGQSTITVRQILTSGVPIAGISSDGNVRQIQKDGTEIVEIIKE